MRQRSAAVTAARAGRSGAIDTPAPFLERALALSEKTLGPEHPRVATRLSNLAAVLKDLGDATGVRPLLERALAISEKTFGPEHPSVRIIRQKLDVVSALISRGSVG